MALNLVEILQEHWPSYQRANRSRLCSAHYRAVRCVLACRTPELGGRLYQCRSCQKNHFAYHSCNHRSCPNCGAAKQEEWTARQEARLLPVPYFLITFTVPSELRNLAQHFPKELYDLILKESSIALCEVTASKLKRPHLRIGITSVLHTWGRQMQHHPHVHCIVPTLGYDPIADELIRPKKDQFFVHFKPLAERFRNRLRKALKEQHPEIYQRLTSAQLKALSPSTNWNVHLQHAGSGKTAVRYLARYVNRTAFHPKRLLGYDQQGRIRLKYTSSQTKQTSIIALSAFEFIRRFLIHVLPKGFARIRHYGYCSSAAKKTYTRIRLLCGCGGDLIIKLPQRDPFTCSDCGGKLNFLSELERIPRISAPRGPPQSSRPALTVNK